MERGREDSKGASEDRYKLLFEKNPLPMWIYDLETLSILSVNNAAVSEYGFSREEFLSMTLKDLHPPEDREVLVESVRGLQGEYRKPGAWRHRTKKGRLIDVKITTHDIDLDGRKARLVFADNISEQKKSEEFVRKVLETVDEGFLVIDEDYRIVSANRAYLSLVHKSCEEVAGRHCYEVTHHLLKPCHESGEDCPVLNTFNTGQPKTALHIHRGDTRTAYVEVKSYPIKDETGRVISVIAVINDITEKKRLEEQLRHAQKLEAVGQLAGGVAHDFNNILSAIVGYGQLLQMKMKEGDPLRANVDQIMKATERAANLTHSLLAFSRKQMINPQAVNLNEIIRKVGKFLERVIGEDVELKTMLRPLSQLQPAEDVPELNVMADSGQIEQMLMNLATNARDAMPQGGCLTIGSELIDLGADFMKVHGYGRPGTYVLMTVTDTGIGMDQEMRKKIFEPFFTTKDMGKGTGLGLSMVYGIVKQHNGYIDVYSEPGNGTTFKVYLPALSHRPEGPGAAEAASYEGLSMQGNETILLAEDDPAVRSLTKMLLAEFGYTVIEAEDGEEAIKKFIVSKDSVQLLLFDLIMPKKNGREAYEEIRKISPDMKVLFASGYTADIIHKKEFLETGQDLILKPISPRELMLKVREILDRRPPGIDLGKDA